LKGLGKASGDELDPDDIASGLDLAGLKGIGDIDTELGDVADGSGKWFVSQLGVARASEDEMFGQVNDRAVAYARARGAELVSGVDEATRDEMGRLIAQGLEENEGLDRIRELLSDAYAFSDDRADLIARTEVAMANQYGALEGMKTARDIGITIKKVWLPDAMACDDCQDNGDAGAIDLDDVFPTGDDAPPAHPNCRCDMASEIEEDENGDIAIDDAADDEE
jgi:hypothetical protein